MMTFYLTQFCVFPHWTSRQLHRAGRGLLITPEEEETICTVVVEDSVLRHRPCPREDKLTVGDAAVFRDNFVKKKSWLCFHVDKA